MIFMNQQKLYYNVKNRLKKGCIIILAQCYNYSGWKNGEFKALTEVLMKVIINLEFLD